MFQRRRGAKVERAGTWKCPDCGLEVPITATNPPDAPPRLDFSAMNVHIASHDDGSAAAPAP